MKSKVFSQPRVGFSGPVKHPTKINGSQTHHHLEIFLRFFSPGIFFIFGFVNWPPLVCVPPLNRSHWSKLPPPLYTARNLFDVPTVVLPLFPPLSTFYFLHLGNVTPPNTSPLLNPQIELCRYPLEIYSFLVGDDPKTHRPTGDHPPHPDPPCRDPLFPLMVW